MYSKISQGALDMLTINDKKKERSNNFLSTRAVYENFEKFNVWKIALMYKK